MSDTTDRNPLNRNPRILALMAHLGSDPDDYDIFDVAAYDETTIEDGRDEYLVLTDTEADTLARERAESDLWAFNTSFLCGYIPALRNNRAADAFAKMQGSLCEDAGDLIAAMLGDNLDRCIDDAVSCDGRAHFLASYDGYEYEAQGYYIFRVN